MFIGEEKEWSPCRIACPVHTNVRNYIELIAAGKHEEAFELLGKPNPFPSVCSRICPHPCEEECRRNVLDFPLAVRDLKRFACEQSLAWRKENVRIFPKTKKESVAIIGGGPSGLTAALDLAKSGYSVAVFERSPVLGGVLATAIPGYRLPRNMLQEDIDDILATGIEVRLNCEIGQDIKFDDLKLMGFDAILISIGLSTSRSLQIPGIESKGVLLALPFLRDVAFGNAVEIGKDVIVIGGGNVAIDVARSALRLGADSVTTVCLESSEEMPAWKWEIEEAREEGIKMICSHGPNRIIQKDGKVAGLEMKFCECVFDEQGRFNPKFCEDEISEMEGDTVIVAIGQAPDLSFLVRTNLLNERGQLIFDRDSMMTKEDGVFASGEVLTGPGAAIEAIASGHKAAKAIDAYIRGKPLAEVTLEEKPKIASLPEETYEKIKKAGRQQMPILSAEERKRDFEPFELGLSEKAALFEARRCLNCGAGAQCLEEKCIACLTCVRICPYGAPMITPDGSVAIRLEQCLACGICASECPAKAIALRSYRGEEVIQRIDAALAEASRSGSAPVILGLCCSYGPYAMGEFNEFLGTKLPPNIRVVKIPCVAKIETNHLLKAFELGADGVFVAGCGQEDCPYHKSSLWIERRVETTKKILTEIGLGAERLQIYLLSEPLTPQFVEKIAEITERVKELHPIPGKGRSVAQ